MAAWVFEYIARFYGYNAENVPASARYLYQGVVGVCGQLSPLAEAFYAALSLC